MNEINLWSALIALRELTRETNALIQIENESKKIAKLEKLRKGLEDILARLDRNCSGVVDVRWPGVDTETENDLFKDIPQRLSIPLVAELKGWSFHVENADKYHLIYVKFSPIDQTSLCEKVGLIYSG